MSVLLKILYINDILVPIFAIFCNILLLWLIKTVKTKDLIHINYSLVPNSFLEITLAVVTFIVAPHVFHIDGYVYVVFGDLFESFFTYNFARHLAAFLSGLGVICSVSVTVSFYLRFLVIVRSKTISLRSIILPYIILLTFLFFFGILCFFFYLPDSESYKNLKSSELTNLWNSEYGRMPLFVGNKITSPIFLILFFFLSIIYTFAYGTIFYFSKQISNKLKSHIDNNINSGTKLLHKQVQRTLFIQAIGPFLISSFPTALIVTKSFLKFSGIELSLILSLFIPWMSLTNPIAAFIFIKPYRNYIKNMLKFVFRPFLGRKENSVSIILPASKNVTK